MTSLLPPGFLTPTGLYLAAARPLTDHRRDQARTDGPAHTLQVSQPSQPLKAQKTTSDLHVIRWHSLVEVFVAWARSRRSGTRSLYHPGSP